MTFSNLNILISITTRNSLQHSDGSFHPSTLCPPGYSGLFRRDRSEERIIQDSANRVTGINNNLNTLMKLPNGVTNSLPRGYRDLVLPDRDLTQVTRTFNRDILVLRDSKRITPSRRIRLGLITNKRFLNHRNNLPNPNNALKTTFPRYLLIRRRHNLIMNSTPTRNTIYRIREQI